MYTSTIGKIFLDAYNEKYQTEYSAKEFFTEVFIPLFYDHHKYMMPDPTNSPLSNGIGNIKKLPKVINMIKSQEFESAIIRKKRIEILIDKIDTTEPSSNIAFGYGVLDVENAANSLISNIILPPNSDNTYLSWIGAGFGINVEGGWTLLFHEKKLLLDIFDGWKLYRDYLERYPMMKGNQINIWNGIWLTHRYSDDFDEYMPTAGINPIDNNEDGILSIKPKIWLDIIWSIASYYKTISSIVYIYAIGKSNTTIGFIPIIFDEITRPYIFYEKIFGKESLKYSIKKLREIYGTNKGFKSATERGSIGIQAMKPKDLTLYMPRPKSKSVKHKTDEDKVTFNIYLIWIIAMLNNEKMWDLSQDFAKVLSAYEKGAPKASRARANNVSQLLESSTPRSFIENLIPIVKDAESEIVEMLSQTGKTVNEMPRDNYPYFATLIKFQYALSNK